MSKPYEELHPMAAIDAMLGGEGMPHEIETRVVDGRMMKVYKNLWPSIRDYFFWSTETYAEATVILFEGQRITFSEIKSQALKAAAVFRDVYKVKKGDRVGIISRNNPSYMVAFWATTLLGAIPTLVNSYLPTKGVTQCLINTTCKLVVVDTTIADKLEATASKVVQACGATGILVLSPLGSKSSWKGMSLFDDAMNKYRYRGDAKTISYLEQEKIGPEDDACILFTSGTTGTPKGVLTTQRAFLSVIPNSLASGVRALLKDGREPPPLPEEGDPQRACLIVTPLFHVTAVSIFMVAGFLGLKIVMMRKWDMDEAIKLIKEENVVSIGTVPSVIMDLLESSLKHHPSLEALTFGGAPPAPNLPTQVSKAFPSANLAQAYGSTETMATAVGHSGNDYISKPGSTGVPCPINQVKVVSPEGVVLSAREVGEIWLRGSNLMKCYWNDPEATAKALTKDGWFMSGDKGYIDEEGYVYVKDRIKDIIIRGGENVDSIMVENALYEADDRLLETAAVGVPDKRLNELVTAVVTPKPAFRAGQISEQELIERVKPLLPSFGVPVMIIVLDHPMERTASGKILKPVLRALAAKEWMRRMKAPVKKNGAKL